MILLTTTYFGNIQYYSKLLSGEEVCIEAYENFTKQSYRNRCDILTANGVSSLSIPVKKGSGGDKIPIREVEIDYATDWQKQHWKSISSAYGSSAYFDYFDYIFQPLYAEKEKYLFDYNSRCMETVFKCLGISPEIRFTEEYNFETENPTDYRESLSPKAGKKRDDPCFRSVDYYQVFADRYEFQSNLSILDVLFCEGRDTMPLLKKSFVAYGK